MAARPIYAEIGRDVKPWTVYLAINQRYDAIQGDFQWAIVMSMATGSSCVVFRACNQRLGNLVEGVWRIEESPAGQWQAETSASLLCMFEIKSCERSDIMDHQRAVISQVGHIIMHNKSVTPMRFAQPFSCKTFALDVLALTIQRVNGQPSVYLESCATAAALRCRQQALEESALFRAGWYKIYRMEMAPPM
ncbi:hypothetical protein F4805DRAFT_415962 [Annulohypoxylon moriforme]|nr:hypothetical protein F4805DRAFT_415962 [Annulohypoxylon moriforme]